jgi:putative ABC transport system permease protein
MINSLKLIERNMRRNSRRTILTIFTIALATFVYTILVSVPASMDRIVNDASRTLRLVVRNKTEPWGDLPAHYCDQVRTIRGCVACVGITGWFSTWRDVSEPIFAYAAGPEIGDVFPDYQISADLAEARARERRSAIVGSVLMKKKGWKLGQQITLRNVNANHIEMTFVLLGTIKSKRYPNMFLFRRDYLTETRKAHGLGDDDFAWQLIVRADSAKDLAPLAREIDEHFTNSGYETITMTESDALASGLSRLGDLRGMVFAFCAVVVLTMLLIAANSTAMMVRERIGEVAVMRTVGFGRGSISILLFGEAGAIGFIGGLVGAGAAFWMFRDGVALGAVLRDNGALWVTSGQATGALVVAVTVTLGSGLLPILEALRISPAIAFRKVI